MATSGTIRIEGARQNNLQNLTFDLPLGMFHVLTGPSGSGKSSLAFDTLYAEGQRRYAETFSPYTRQFLERMDRPRVDRIDGIPPAIALGQAKHPLRRARRPFHGPRCVAQLLQRRVEHSEIGQKPCIS